MNAYCQKTIIGGLPAYNGNLNSTVYLAGGMAWQRHVQVTASPLVMQVTSAAGV